MTKTRTVKSKSTRWLELVLIGCALLAFFCASIQHIEFHPDESYWIATSDHFEAFAKAEFASPVWHGSYWTSTGLPLTRYLIGIGRRIGGYRVADLILPWDFRLDRAANIARGAMPGPGLLWWSRLPMAVLAVVCGMIAFILVSRSAGRLAGYVMLVLFVVNPYFLYTLCRAMNEAPLLASTLLAALAGHQALISCKHVAAWTDNTARAFFRSLIWFAIMGMFCGMAGVAKINGLSILPAGLALCVIAPLAQKGISRSRLLGFITSAGAVTILAAGFAFVALNPYLYPAPLRHTYGLVATRLKTMKIQQAEYPSSRMGDSLTVRLPLVAQRVFSQYAALNFPGSWVGNIPLCLVGLCYLLYTAWYWLHSGIGSGASAVLLLIAFTSAAPTLSTPLDWDRYYLFAVFFSTISIAVGVSWVIKSLSLWVGDRRLLSQQRSGQ